MRKIGFTAKAFAQFNSWRDEPEIQNKIIRLLTEATTDPFKGTGKPEPLKGNLQGYWSRRITEEHRLVYEVKKDEILVVSCYSHYRNL